MSLLTIDETKIPFVLDLFPNIPQIDKNYSQLDSVNTFDFNQIVMQDYSVNKEYLNQYSRVIKVDCGDTDSHIMEVYPKLNTVHIKRNDYDAVSRGESLTLKVIQYGYDSQQRIQYVSKYKENSLKELTPYSHPIHHASYIKSVFHEPSTGCYQFLVPAMKDRVKIINGDTSIGIYKCANAHLCVLNQLIELPYVYYHNIIDDKFIIDGDDITPQFGSVEEQLEKRYTKGIQPIVLQMIEDKKKLYHLRLVSGRIDNMVDYLFANIVNQDIVPVCIIHNYTPFISSNYQSKPLTSEMINKILLPEMYVE